MKKHFKTHQPLVLTANGNNLYYPNSGGIFTIRKNQMIKLACPNTTITIAGLNFNKPQVTATCIEDDVFNVDNNGGMQLGGGVSCSKSLSTSAQRVGATRGLEKVEVRFSQLNLDPQVTYYFDDYKKTTPFAVYHLNPNIGRSTCGHPSTFTESSFFSNISINALYTKNKQRENINNLLGITNPSNTKYIKDAGEYYLARGHLASHCDFVFEAQQKATYYYINVAPQWQTFNNGNWKALEIDLRNYAARYQLDLLIIAGTFGVATLPHEINGIPTELYLSVTPNKKAIPVPKFYWKLAFDSKNQRGAVFIGMNNPYESKKDVVCKDVSSSMTWLNWKNNDVKKGYSFACSIRDFMNVINYLPVSVDARNGLLL